MPKRRAIWIFLAILLLYPASYLVVSSDGDYREFIRPADLTPENGEYTFIATLVWSPFGNLRFSDQKLSQALVYFYRPLIFIDCRYWHQEMKIE
jgi:hypothetical protein